MKLTKLVIALLLFVAITISCNSEDSVQPVSNKTFSNEQKMDFKTTDWKLDLNIDFSEKFDVGYLNTKELDKVITKITNELFKEKGELDQELLGFNITIGKNSTTIEIEPLTEDNINEYE